jgi:gas vesicle protein
MTRRDDEAAVTIIETDSGGGVKWFLLGALIGASAGLLFAPQSGERTRRDISRRARRLRDETGERWDELKEGVSDRAGRVKDTVGEWADDVKEEVREGRRAIGRKAASARDDLEQRLADARERRHATVAADGVADDGDEDEPGA